MPIGNDPPTRRNLVIWTGLVTMVLAVVSYPVIFVRFPVTRDFPWVNLLLLGLAGCLVFSGVWRAFRYPAIYRGRIGGSIVAALFIVLAGFFLWGTFFMARQMPASASAPRVGQKAPDFILPDENGKPAGLSGLLKSSQGVVLIFYRGYW